MLSTNSRSRIKSQRGELETAFVPCWSKEGGFPGFLGELVPLLERTAVQRSCASTCRKKEKRVENLWRRVRQVTVPADSPGAKVFCRLKSTCNTLYRNQNRDTVNASPLP